jgi:Domain of unknown function (DUF3560)
LSLCELFGTTFCSIFGVLPQRQRLANVSRIELDTFMCRERERNRRARTSIRRSPQTPIVGFTMERLIRSPFDGAGLNGSRRHNAARRELEIIPPGQPILVGHHSDKGHRAHLNRIDRHFAKAKEHHDKARSPLPKSPVADPLPFPPPPYSAGYV